MKRRVLGVKTPAFYRLMNNATVYIIFLIIGLLSILGLFYSGYKVHSRIMTIGQEPSEFVLVSGEKPPSVLWGEEVVEVVPPGVSDWVVKSSLKPRHIVDVNSPDCLNIGVDLVSEEVLSTFTASGDGVEIGVQILSPGMGLTILNKYSEKISDCLPAHLATSGEYPTLFYEDSFMMLVGDVLLNVKTNTPEEISALLNFYQDLLNSTLPESGCLSMKVVKEDRDRGFYNDISNYIGLLESVTVETEIDVEGLPTPTNLTFSEINPVRLEMNEPEGPLPDDFPKLPAEVVKPEIPFLMNDDKDFRESAFYTIKDEDGPGCGWVWHGQKPPIFNSEVLEETRRESIQTMQMNLNNLAENFVKDNIAWNIKILHVYPKIQNWNLYVKRSEKVYSRWDWLNAERDLLAPLWYSYIGELESWETFDDRKEESQRAYDRAVKKCEEMNEELEEWEDEYGELFEEEEEEEEEVTEDEEAEEDDEDEEDEDIITAIPPKPAGCTTLPEKPSILEMNKPAKPAPPVIPEGVTVPYSWPRSELAEAIIKGERLEEPKEGTVSEEDDRRVTMGDG